MTKAWLAIILGLVSTGCVHAIALTGQEECGQQSMSLAGASLGYERAVSSARFDGEARGRTTGNAYDVSGRSETVTNSSSVTYQCRMPAPTEWCEVRAAGTAAAIKSSYDPRWRNMLIGLGYYAFVIPGVVLYSVFDGQSADTQKRADEQARRAYMQCLAMIAPPRAPAPATTPAPVPDGDKEPATQPAPPAQASDFEAPAH